MRDLLRSEGYICKVAPKQYKRHLNSTDGKLGSKKSSIVRGTTRSVLGPLLFLVYINRVSLVPLSEGSRISMYADDILS